MESSSSRPAAGRGRMPRTPRSWIGGTGRGRIPGAGRGARSLLGPLVGVCALLAPGEVTAQAQADGAALFASSCAGCHGGGESERAPDPFMLGSMSPRAIVAALVDGPMRAEGAELTEQQRIAVAEHLTGRGYAETSLPESAYCVGAGRAALDLGAVSWMGFGGDLAGSGFQPAHRAGLTAADVPALELDWAFGFPDAAQVRTKPTVVGDVVLVGGAFGDVLALDAATGCVRWTFEADAGIRGAILVGAGDDGRSVAWFVDFRTNVYALDVARGDLRWKTLVGWHPNSSNTGSPVLYDGRLIVPISSMEVVVAADPGYPCCTSSGAVAALDAVTGDVLWYHRVIPGDPEQVGENAAGTPLWAPSGAPVWSSPTIDTTRGRIYVGTGESYTRPASPFSDAILALDIETGERVWSFQGTEGDAFTLACTGPDNRQNCPSPPGPDVDFGMAPVIVSVDGRDVLVAGQKSGVVWALDPDRDGTVLWSTRVGKGSALGGIHWGMATDGRLVYAANADRDAVIVDTNPERELTPGVYALDPATGDVVWAAPAPGDTCADRPGCFRANSAAPTVIPGVVFAGGLDGYIRAHGTDDGRLLWAFDTAREIETVNGVRGRGGAIDGPGPVVAGGRLFVNSGYGSFGQMPGNLLLVFTPSR